MNLPNIKEARARTNKKVEIKRDEYHLSSSARQLGIGKNFSKAG